MGELGALHVYGCLSSCGTLRFCGRLLCHDALYSFGRVSWDRRVISSRAHRVTRRAPFPRRARVSGHAASHRVRLTCWRAEMYWESRGNRRTQVERVSVILRCVSERVSLVSRHAGSQRVGSHDRHAFGHRVPEFARRIPGVRMAGCSIHCSHMGASLFSVRS